MERKAMHNAMKFLSMSCLLVFGLTTVADADARGRRRHKRTKKVPPVAKTPVVAQPTVSPAKATAIKLLRSGLTKLNGGQYYEAIEDFKKGLKLYESASFYYNMGLAYRELRKYVSALHAFEKYVSKAKNKTGQYYKLAREWTNLLGRRIATVRVTVNVPGARITVGGIDAGTSPNVRAIRIQPEANRHYDIKVTKAGYETESGKDRQIRLSEGQVVTVKVKLITAVEATGRRKEFQRVAAERRRIQERLERERKQASVNRAKRKRQIQVGGWSLVASGALIAVVGGALGIVSLTDKFYVEGATANTFYDNNYSMRYDRSVALSKAAWASIGSGLAIAAAGGILLLWNQRNTETAHGAPDKPKVSILPSVGPGGVSMTLNLRF